MSGAHDSRFRSDPVDARLDLILRNSEFAARGQRVVEESTYHFNGFEPVRVNLLADWTANPLGHRSWQWHTASFNFMPWLLAYYGREQKEPTFALDAIASWRQAFHERLGDYEFASHDHATALRAENVLMLLAYLRRFGLGRAHWAGLEELIDLLCARLECDRFYSRHTNHGVEQARILAYCAWCLPDIQGASARWSLALARLTDELDFAFTDDGVHVENSPGYHVFVCNAFLKIAEAFPDGTLERLGERIDACMPKAMRFLAHVVRPDAKLPIIGDTEQRGVTCAFARYAGQPEYRWLAFATSGGRRGIPAPETTALFADAGYFTLRDRWRKDHRATLHLILKCGYRSRYHRHDDDLNIVLMFGEDWLVDGGAHSYAEATEIRRYLRSRWAHNVPVIDTGGERWPIIDRSRHDTSLDATEDGDGVRVEATTGGYPGFEAARVVRFDPKRRGFIVHDRLEPTGEPSSQLFRSLWHLPDDKDIYRRNQDFLVVSRRARRALRISNIGQRFGSVGEFVPTLAGERGAVFSRGTNQLAPARVLSFNHRGERLDATLRFDFLDRFDTAGWTPLDAADGAGA